MKSSEAILAIEKAEFFYAAVFIATIYSVNDTALISISKEQALKTVKGYENDTVLKVKSTDKGRIVILG